MRIEFAKMHGLGNDFVVLDGVTRPLPPGLLSAAAATQIADRKRGIGCDQLLVLQAAAGGGAGAADFIYRIFNADGGEVGQCGNGARCAHAFLLNRGITDKPVLSLTTMTTQMQTRRQEGSIFRAVMQKPQYGGEKTADGHAFQFLDLGNPHAVSFSAPTDEQTLIRLAAELAAAAPHGVNVGIGRAEKDGIALRVCERGSGMTDACGSGALAAACVAIRAGLSPNPVAVSMPGGALLCGLDAEGKAWLEGEVAHAFDGAFVWEDGKFGAAA